MHQQPSSYHQQEIDLTELGPDSSRAEQSTGSPPRSETLGYFIAAARSTSPYVSPYARSIETEGELSTNPTLHSQSIPGPSTSPNPESNELSLTDFPGQASMSAYSSSSANSPIYDSPDSQKYRGTIGIMNNSTQISSVSISPQAQATQELISNTQSEKQQLIRSLQTHRVNTLIELRRIEKVFATLNSADITEPMTSAWVYYVNSNNLLSELRGLTKNYPFSSECLDEAKWQVIGDPASTRSWNFCWLILTKIQSE